MTISYTQYYLLQSSTHDATIHTNVLQNTPTYDTMKTPIRGRERHNAGYDKRQVLIRRGHRQNTQQNGRICTALVSQWRTARCQSGGCLVYAPARLAELSKRTANSFQSHAGAQAQKKVASQEALNVESLSSESLPDRSDNRPRFSVQLSVVRTTSLCKHTAENGVAQRKRMTVQVVRFAMGGKCVAA